MESCYQNSQPFLEYTVRPGFQQRLSLFHEEGEEHPPEDESLADIGSFLPFFARLSGVLIPEYLAVAPSPASKKPPSLPGG